MVQCPPRLTVSTLSLLNTVVEAVNILARQYGHLVAARMELALRMSAAVPAQVPARVPARVPAQGQVLRIPDTDSRYSRNSRTRIPERVPARAVGTGADGLPPGLESAAIAAERLEEQ